MINYKRYVCGFLKTILPKSYFALLLAYRKYGLKIKKICVEGIRNFFRIKFYRGDFCKSFHKMMQKISIKYETEFYFYSIDTNAYRRQYGIVVDNCSIEYETFLDYSLNDLRRKSGKTSVSINSVIDDILLYIDRIDEAEVDFDVARNISYIKRMKDYKAENLEEALQRILFINQLLWQTGHRLVGLGRLDKTLSKYISDEIDDEEIRKLLKYFLKALHKDFYYKSNVLSGDTGQLIILGGCDEKGNIIHNRLTELFLDVIAELKIPDPKILLRVSKGTDDKLWAKAIDCLNSKVGSPLFSNDEVIIGKLKEFGYEEEDARNYTTSACWEPVASNCLEQNNLMVLNFLSPFNVLNNKLENYESYNDVIIDYKKELKNQIDYICYEMSTLKYDFDPLVSLSMKYCRENDIDISDGGGKYKSSGILSVGMSNAINSLLVIKDAFLSNGIKKVAEKVNNNNPDGKVVLDQCFGTDCEEVIELTNDLVKYTGEQFAGKTNSFGGRIKFGLSAPDYIKGAKKVGATPDGRKAGMPMGVHISSDGGVTPTELINFASQIKYPLNGFNGNVIDFFVSGNMINDHKDVFCDLLKGGIRQGFFQLQMNILDSETLIAARKDPGKFPNLIVRVWGFSAYFNDLPDDYKDYLIERAIASERAS